MRWKQGVDVTVLTSCLQAEIFSDLLVVTWVGEVKDAVTSEVHLKNKNDFMKFKMNKQNIVTPLHKYTSVLSLSVDSIWPQHSEVSQTCCVSHFDSSNSSLFGINRRRRTGLWARVMTADGIEQIKEKCVTSGSTKQTERTKSTKRKSPSSAIQSMSHNRLSIHVSVITIMIYCLV